MKETIARVIQMPAESQRTLVTWLCAKYGTLNDAGKDAALDLIFSTKDFQGCEALIQVAGSGR